MRNGLDQHQHHEAAALSSPLSALDSQLSTQLIHLDVRLTYVSGHEIDGAEYERTVLAYWREHGGEVLAAFRPAAWVNGSRAADEIQHLRIPSRAQLDAYMGDPRRVALAHVRDRTIASTEVVISELLLDR